MEEQKPPAKGVEKNKVVLTPGQKDEIRQEMTKCRTPQEAREHRRLLAEYYGVTVAQIAAVSAYKVRPDGSLSLEPQFSKVASISAEESLELPPRAVPEEADSAAQVEEMYDTPTKGAWRAKMQEAIRNAFDEDRVKNARVVCLPGQALQEVTEVYLPLGVRPENITCIERDPVVANRMKTNARALNLPVVIFEGTVEKFLQNPHEPVTIASFDFKGPFHKTFAKGLQTLRTADKFMVITNFLQKREQSDIQTALKTFTSMDQTTRAGLQKLKKKPPVLLGSEILGSDNYSQELDKHIAGVMTGKTPLEMSDAREGLAAGIAFYIQFSEVKNAFRDLFAEVNAEPPQLTAHEQALIIENAVLFIAKTIEDAIKEYPRLFERLSPRIDSDPEGNLTHYSNLGKRVFLQLMTPVISYCFTSVMPCDVQRYQYSSERAGSPFQTDIYIGLKWHEILRQKHTEAYSFIREFLRLIAKSMRGKEKITIRLERSGKVLPKNYADSTVHVTLALCANGKPYARVQLRDLQNMVRHFRQLVRENVVAGSEDLFSRPRIGIKSE